MQDMFWIRHMYQVLVYNSAQGSNKEVEEAEMWEGHEQPAPTKQNELLKSTRIIGN